MFKLYILSINNNKISCGKGSTTVVLAQMYYIKTFSFIFLWQMYATLQILANLFTLSKRPLKKNVFSVQRF